MLLLCWLWRFAGLLQIVNGPVLSGLLFISQSFLKPECGRRRIKMKTRKNVSSLIVIAVLVLSIIGTASAVLVLATGNRAGGRIIHVDADATDVNIGSSWAYAVNSLQDALLLAYFFRKPVEIRVAQGTYAPDQGLGIAPGDREASFQLMEGVTVKGGYAGFGAPDPDARDIELYKTILSGDLDGNDGRDSANNSENSYHVVTGSGTDATAILDGFTITGGYASGHGEDLNGGGMYNNAGSPTLINCTFSGNSTDVLIGRGGAIGGEGAGMFNKDSHPTLTKCTFSGNSGNSGGGIYNVNSSPMLADCAFYVNSTQGGGGGMYNSGSNPTLLNCIFTGNSASWGGGGGMYNDRSSPTLTSCTLSDNYARGEGGGGMYNNIDSSPMLADCTFSGNSTEESGGGMYNSGNSCPALLSCIFSENSALRTGGGMYNRHNSEPSLTNCIFSGNDARSGGGMENFGTRGLILLNCTFSANFAEDAGGGMSNIQSGRPTLVNCILWGNIPEQIDGPASVSYSDVEGGFSGEGNIGNIDAAPNFADPKNGDYHLKSQAGRWDAISQTWVLDDVSSPCIDAGNPDNPVGLERFPNGGRINMGAYGGTPEASLSPRQLPRLSDQASNPSPADGTVGVDRNINYLSWTAGLNAVFHDVYLGTDIDAVSDADTSDTTGIYRGRQVTTSYTPPEGFWSPGLYYWRIDEINSDGITITGEVWTFTISSGFKGRGCFTGETDVWVDGALVRISKVTAGQTVGKVTCPATPSVQIEKLEEHEGTYECYDVSLETGNCISVAECHYFLTESGRWVGLQNLKTGTRLQTSKDPIEILSVTKRPVPYTGKVYNLKVEGSDRYLVGEDAIIVRDY